MASTSEASTTSTWATGAPSSPSGPRTSPTSMSCWPRTYSPWSPVPAATTASWPTTYGPGTPTGSGCTGRTAARLPYDRFVACVQNHDQVGNRMLGERLTELVDTDGLKLAAAALLTSPFVPMLFMGEEYVEPARFPYFVSHTEPELVDAVRTGRAAEFAGFAWQGEPPDPQAQATFDAARIDVALARGHGTHAAVFALYRELIAVRAEIPLLHRPDAPDPATTLVPGHETIVLHRSLRDAAVLVAVNADPRMVEVVVPAAPGPWQ